MNKKQFLELLIKSYGLIPDDVHHYRTDGCGGQFEIGVGWAGEGIGIDGTAVIRFAEPDGFNMAVYEILKQAKDEELMPVYVSNKEVRQ